MPSGHDGAILMNRGDLMGKKLTDAKRAAIQRYDAANTRQIHLKLNLNTDADILEHLKEQESIQGYIKELIRRDMGSK